MVTKHPHQYRTELPSKFRAARMARRWLESLPLPQDATDDVRLLANELVTNSVVHAHSDEPIELEVELEARLVRVKVRDHGSEGSPRVSKPRPDEISGRGLFLVERLANRWGVHMDGHTTVWFEIEVGA